MLGIEYYKGNNYVINPGTSRVLGMMAAPPSSVVIINGEVYYTVAASVALLLTFPSDTDLALSENLFDVYT
jgi:hypothetical protein